MAKCRFDDCDSDVHPDRAALGYDYCTAKPCAKRGFVPKTAVGVQLPKSTSMIVGFAEDNATIGLRDGKGARRW